MRCVMMGTGGFAVPTYEAILQSQYELVATVTRPPRRGRGRKPPPNPIQETAQQHGITPFQPDSINSPPSIAWLEAQAADLLIVCDYGQILSSQALGTATRGGINLHASLLPEYRGAAPINWAIYDGRTETGVSVIHMTPKLDGGPVLIQRKIPIDANETAVDIERRLAVIGADAILAAMRQLEAWDGVSEMGNVQSDKQATKAPRLTKENGLIDWSRTARQIHHQVRAFKPWPGSYTYFLRSDGTQHRLIVDQTTVLSGSTWQAPPAQILAVGEIVPDPESLIVCTGNGCLLLDVVQPEGKNKISGAEFLRGYGHGVPLRFESVEPKV